MKSFKILYSVAGDRKQKFWFLIRNVKNEDHAKARLKLIRRNKKYKKAFISKIKEVTFS